ncbi:T9SS type A sorting domain-containing protein [Ekhidna sp.]|uniref:T9SS type A sorting domain-containing protein n=1 Tax=Ekhidna sp. TaxID=2608089 RepID=UPI00329793B9
MKKTPKKSFRKRFVIFLLSVFIGFQSFSQSDYYWVGGTGNWTDFANHWATSSGGNVFHTSAPGTENNVFFDENSFAFPGEVVTIGGEGTFALCKDLNWTGAFAATLNFIGGDTNDGKMLVAGSVTLNDNLTLLIKELRHIPNNENVLFDSRGISMNETDLLFNLGGGGISIEDSISAKNISIFFPNDTLDFNGYPVHALNNIAVQSPGSGTIDLVSSKLYAKSINLTQGIADLKSSNTEVHIIYVGGTTQIDRTKFVNPPFDKYFIHASSHSFIFFDPKFNELHVDPGVFLNLFTSVLEVEFNRLVAKGDRDNQIRINGHNDLTFKQNGGSVDVEFVSIDNVKGIGSAEFNAYASIPINSTDGWIFSKIDQEITFDLDVNKDYEDVGELIDLSATTNSDLEIIYTSSDESVVRVIGSSQLEVVGVGTADITASQAGDEYYTESTKTNVINIAKADQILDFESIEDQWIGDQYVSLSISSNTELPITFEINGPVEKDGDFLNFTGTGPVEVIASQVGNDNYNEAIETSISFEIIKANQEITFNDISDTWIGDELVNINATSDSELPLTYQINGPATIVGSVLTLSGEGTVQIIASQQGNDDYKPAPDVIKQFEVYKKEQTITFAEIQDIPEDASFVNLDATSDAGLEVTYSVVGPGEVVDGAMEFTGYGIVQVTAKQMGNEFYSAAEDVRRSFEILASTSEKPLFLTQPEGLGMIYPNPVADYLYFDRQLKIESIYVSDLSGKVFYNGAVKGDQLDVSSWEAGTYILSIKTSGGDTYTGRLIKN